MSQKTIKPSLNIYQLANSLQSINRTSLPLTVQNLLNLMQVYVQLIVCVDHFDVVSESLTRQLH